MKIDDFDYPTEYPCEYLHKLYVPRNYIFAAFGVSERRIFAGAEYVLAVQGHPRSLTLAPIERAFATSY